MTTLFPSTPPLVASPRASRRTWVGLTTGLLIATFLLTRHTQISALEGLAAPWAMLLLLACLRWNRSLPIAMPMLAYALLSALFSLARGNETAAVLRFLIITVGTVLAFHIRPSRISVPWALAPVALQALIVGALSVTLGFLQDGDLASAVRSVAIDEDWGDIYSFDGVYYRVQLIGNALLPLLFMIAIWRWHAGRIWPLLSIVALFGLIAAGNLTYFGVIALAVLFRLRRSVVARALLIIVLPIALAFTWTVIDDAVSRKFEGGDSSMGVRFDQLEAAEREMASSTPRLLFGAGLGARFPDGQQRYYSQAQYIELQSLYFLLQLGFIGLSLYVVTLWVMARQQLDSDGRRIFWLYMLSGLTNPYILDANQIVATMILVCTFPRRRDQPTGSTPDTTSRTA